MRITDRDIDWFEDIYDLGDGILPRRLVKQLHWPDASWRVMDRRISTLCEERYLDRPTPETYRREPIPERICWLGYKGALLIAARRGVEVASPARENTSQMKNLQKRLRERNIRWLRTPRFKQLTHHDIPLIDTRLAFEKAFGQLPSLTLEMWVPESAFHPADKVAYKLTGADGQVRRMEKGIRPDGFMLVVDEERRAKGQFPRQRFLVEYLSSTGFDNPRYGAEKVAVGVAYIKSAAYKQRFGYNKGRWLIISGSTDLRLARQRKETKKVAGDDANLFLFTTFEQLQNAANPVTSPIWLTVDNDQPGPLIV